MIAKLAGKAFPMIERCVICHNVLHRHGEDWGDLCPECADSISTFLDDTDLDDRHADQVITLVQRMCGRP
jgi:hypothetical protein